MTRLAIFASGEGTNAENLIRYFSSHPTIEVTLLIANRKEAGALRRARNLGVEAIYWNKAQWADEAQTLTLLRESRIDFIVLAGFLLLVPDYLVKAYEGRIVNIHPALIPNYCGKGMYGMRVHEAVVEAGEKETGITIHLVDEVYDHGRILCQATCKVAPEDTPEDVAQKVHALEWTYFPKTIENYIKEELQ